MDLDRKDPPRRYTVKGVNLQHSADIRLKDNETVTFITPEGAEYDVTAKDWGFYATPSTNGRLKDQGFRTALVRSQESGRRYVLLVLPARFDAFETYCREQNIKVESWLDEEG